MKPVMLTFDFGDEAFQARLLTEKAPIICRQVVAHLPVKTFAVHAKFAGEELITMVPFFAEPENEILDVRAGDIGYYPGRQTFCLFYGHVVPFGEVSVFASVIDPPEKLKALGVRVLKSGSLPLQIRAGEGAIPHSEPVETASVGSLASGLRIPWIDEFHDAIWEMAPSDLARLTRVSRPPMGNLPCVLYACFNLFWLGEELQVARQLARDQSLPLASIQKILASLLLRHAGRLEKWDMIESTEFLRRLSDLFLHEVRSLETCLSVIDQVLVAVDRLQSWVDTLVPWARLDSRLLRN